MEKKHSHAGHRGRLRGRYLAAGQDGLYEHELLELLLFYARPVVNTNNIAHDLIDRFGSMGKALSANMKDLSAVKGVGSGGALFLKLMYDLGLSCMNRSHTGEILSTRSILKDYIARSFSGSSARVCDILCLSSRSELLRTVTLPVDEILSGNMTAKELASIIIKSEAAIVCIGINHGKGTVIPTDTDYRLTGIFAELLSAVGVLFSDCIIHGSGSCFSMRGNGAFAF